MRPLNIRISNDGVPYHALENSFKKLFRQIRIKDSIFLRYPFMEMELHAGEGVLIEEGLFIEGMTYNVGFDYNDDILGLPYLPGIEGVYHKFFVSESRFQQHSSKNTPDGNIYVALTSDLVKQDSVTSLAYPGPPNVAAAAVGVQFFTALPIAFQNTLIPYIPVVTPCSNLEPFWYRNETALRFLSDLSNYAYSPVFPTSPFFSFFNLKGEMYFTAAEQIMLQKPTATYLIGSDKIHNWKLMNGSLLNTMETLHVQNWRIDPLGNEVPSAPLPFSSPITHKFLSSTGLGENRLLLKTDVGPIKGKTKKSSYGLFDPIEEIPSELGFINSTMREQFFNYRMTMLVDFAPQLSSGRTIFLGVTSNSLTRLIATEYTGLWVILECEHLINYRMQAYTRLILGKNALAVSLQNPIKALLV